VNVGVRDHPGINLGHAHGEHHEAAEVPVFGFWVFMMSDLIIFGLLFATYVSMLGGTAGGPGPRDLFDLVTAGLETTVLLASSFTFGMASLALKYDSRQRALLAWLGVTLVLGIGFLGLELYDFYSMAQKGGVPSRSGYLSAFFALVPLHGLHVFGASIWMVALIGQLFVHGVDKDVKIGILRLGILWHFLDIIWVGIFSVVYLGGLA
jgi:cytochrome o ubiquinol oxidase subunit 3